MRSSAMSRLRLGQVAERERQRHRGAVAAVTLSGQRAAVQRDEAKNCAILIDLIRRKDATPSTATGDFLGKALAVKGRVARLQFLNRGQAWVARKIGDALPCLEKGFVRDALFDMQASHRQNIEACDSLVSMLESRRNGNDLN